MYKKKKMKSIKINNLEISNNKPFILFAGPCVIETRDHALKIAESIYKKVLSKC